MSFEHIKAVYFIGIGGIGMSALARYFNASGKCVSGYDKTPTALTDELQSEGIAVHFDENISLARKQAGENIAEALIIYTPAIPAEHAELNFFRSHNYTLLKRSEVLGLITQNHFTIAVAGTHGKTTVSSIIAHLLKHSRINCMAFMGGISKNYNTNILLPESTEGKQKPPADEKNKLVIVVEADEYARSFLSLHPDIAVITSMDADHLDIYGSKDEMQNSYRLFARQTKPNGMVISKNGLSIDGLSCMHKKYALEKEMNADYYATNIRIENHQYRFTWHDGEVAISNLATLMPGRHNAENAVAAIAAARACGISKEEVEKAINTYSGVKRRFEYIINTPELVFIDDYAHHPEELRACIASVKELYPGRKITGIFQPHLYSRTRDFAADFAKSLSMLDELLLLDIYPAREEPIAGVTAAVIYDKVTTNKAMCKKEEVVRELQSRKIEVLLTLGAGDIDRLVEPLGKALLKR